MYKNNFRKLRPAQSGQPLLTPAKPGLQPQPPPKTNVEKILVRKELNLKKPVTLPTIFGSYKTERYASSSLYGIFFDQSKAEHFRQTRYKCYLEHMNVAQLKYPEKSAVSERERKAKNDRIKCEVDRKPRFKEPIAPEATKAAQDQMRTRQARKDITACESKVRESGQPKEPEEEEENIKKKRNISKTFLIEQRKMLEKEESAAKETVKKKIELNKVISELPLLDLTLAKQETEKAALCLEIRELEITARESQHQSFQYSRLTDWVQNTFDKLMECGHPEIKDPMTQMSVIQNFFRLYRSADLAETALRHSPEVRISKISGKSRTSFTRMQIAPEATKAAQDQMRTRQERDEITACESEVSCVGDVCCDSDEESDSNEERDGSNDSIAWQYMTFVEDHEQILKSCQGERERIKEKIKYFTEQVEKNRKQVVKNREAISRMKEQLKYLQFCKWDPMTIRRTIRKLSEKISEFYNEALGHLCSPSFPLVMLADLEEWLLDTMKVIPSETCRRIQKKLFKAYDVIFRQQKEAELEARRAERRKKQLELALAPPPPKTTEKRLVQRSPPIAKGIKKEEPLKTKKKWEI
ncbi:calponin homology domain-containing protein DDB_G0272472-like [Pseudorasbora parva]|uniref:calponin homology domain-containing protein DDB_G0272472-like n=1 Tax=Pseudorasbora parva TaxID=51549 RepID=UPI00351E32A2